MASLAILYRGRDVVKCSVYSANASPRRSPPSLDWRTLSSRAARRRLLGCASRRCRRQGSVRAADQVIADIAVLPLIGHFEPVRGPIHALYVLVKNQQLHGGGNLRKDIGCRVGLAAKVNRTGGNVRDKFRRARRLRHECRRQGGARTRRRNRCCRWNGRTRRGGRDRRRGWRGLREKRAELRLLCHACRCRAPVSSGRVRRAGEARNGRRNLRHGHAVPAPAASDEQKPHDYASPSPHH